MFPQQMKFKALLLTRDGGKTWLCVKQYYLSDATTGRLLDEILQGMRLITIEENHHDKRRAQQ